MYVHYEDELQCSYFRVILELDFFYSLFEPILLFHGREDGLNESKDI